MSTFKKLAQVTMIFFAMMVLFSSCEKDNAEAEQTQTTRPVNGNFLALVGDQSEEVTIDSLVECFVINYPINVNIPGEGEVAVNSEEELWGIIEAYFENAGDDITEFPTMVFPITVTLNDGTVQSVADDQALCDLYHECFGEPGDGGWEDPGNGAGWEDPCFTFAYPLTLSDGNGNTASVNSEEEWLAFYDDSLNYAFTEFVYPVNVVLADGSTQSLQNEEELNQLLEDCYGWEDEGNPIEELCFTFVYPLTMILPDGSNVTITDDESFFNTMMAYYDQNPDADEDPTLAYPIHVILEDGTTQTLNNDEELEALADECYDGFGLVRPNVMVGMARMR